MRNTHWLLNFLEFFEWKPGKIIWFSFGCILTLLCWGSKGWVAFLCDSIIILWVVATILLFAFDFWQFPKLLTKRWW